MPTHAERRKLPYSPEQLFELVADVERYPEFLPWCLAARVNRRAGNEIHADLVIGFRVFRERFTSRVVLDRPHRIDVTYADGPFKYMNNHWIFLPLENGHCEIDFFVDFEFRSRILRAAMGVLFNEAVKLMVSAFSRRAAELYGTAAAGKPTAAK